MRTLDEHLVDMKLIQGTEIRRAEAQRGFYEYITKGGTGGVQSD